MVTQYRELKSKIVNVANDMGDAIDEDRAKDLRGKKKLQHYYSSYLSKHAVDQYEDKVREHGTPHDKARTFSNNGSFVGAWLHSVRQKTRDK